MNKIVQAFFEVGDGRSKSDKIEDMVKAYFEDYEVVPLSPMLVKHGKGEASRTLDLSDLHKSIVNFARLELADSILKKLGIPLAAVETFLEINLERIIFEQVLNELRARLSFPTGTSAPPTATNELAKLAIALNPEATPVDLIIMEHFIWQVKRKLFDLPCVEHMMPIITGGQGTGKSYLLEHKLLSPLGDFMQVRPVDFVTDERNAKSLGGHLVVFFDEMARVLKADEESLKRIISAKEVKYRPLYTNHTAVCPQRCTFIGTSNKDISELIKDTTGNRRFYQIKTAKTIDRELINSIDYEELWREVDEQADCPLYRALPKALHKSTGFVTYMELIKENQAADQVRDSVALFMEEQVPETYGAIVKDTLANPEMKEGWRRVELREVYNKYIDYCNESGYNQSYQHVSKWVFTRKLKTEYNVHAHKSNSKTYYFCSGVSADETEAAKLLGKVLR